MRPWAGEGGFDIGVADVLIAGVVEGERLGCPARAADGGGAGLLVDRGHFGAHAIDPARFAIIAGELDSVAGFQVERLRRERLCFSRTPLPQAPVDLAAILRLEGDGGFGWINSLPASTGEMTQCSFIQICVWHIAVAGLPKNKGMQIWRDVSR